MQLSVCSAKELLRFLGQTLSKYVPNAPVIGAPARLTYRDFDIASMMFGVDAWTLAATRVVELLAKRLTSCGIDSSFGRKAMRYPLRLGAVTAH